ncbi:MBL fold metallo-hydrolase [Paenibacillus ginsengarvi]|uniref:beta-lactamase n=1 Tax=Paenibacillus ginsengarvi TaxID=400777 RepID=A0A3B0C7Z4_9BACL|nr:MBL fold metallo-hydrolase [Paenibacillus ginsengarvi]RKN80691.1 MBL fold metallo-hydrolase [Paenibacillus ginsengarvi]
MKLTERVHVIGGGGLGYGISSDYDCNVYALCAGEHTVIVDAGSGIEPERLFARLDEDGLPHDNIRTLLLTHAHADHSGGAAIWKERFGVEVVAAQATAKMVGAGDEIGTSLAAARASGTYPPWYRLAPCPADRIVSAGETLRFGDLTLTAVAAPGHSFDMVTYYCPELKALFSADAVFAEGRLAVIATPDFSIDQYRGTIASLARLDVRQLFPGHGTALTSGGWRVIEAADRRFRLGEPPLSIV